MDASLLSRVIHELDARLRGGRIDRVRQGRGGDLFLVVAGNRRRDVLLLSPDRMLPRIHLLRTRPEHSGSPTGFGLFLKSHLAGAVIRTVSILNEDRIAEVRCARAGKEYRLIFELFGPHSNVILCDGTLRILALLRPILPDGNRERTLLTGAAYELPRRGGAPRDPGAQERIVLEHAASHDREELPVNRAVETYYEHKANILAENSLRKDLSRFLDKELLKAGRKAAAVRNDLLSAEKAEDHRKAGELLLANLATVGKGAKTAVLAGPDGAGSIVELDPRRTPAENAEAYFRKYKKAKAGRGLLARRMEETKEAISRLERYREEVDAADTIGALEAIRVRVGNGRRVAEGRRETTGNAPENPPPGPYRTFSFAGWVILVGKSAAGNDMITRELSRPDDLWLHAEGVSGSHVLVRNPDRLEVPSQVLLKAASLAAFYSRAKGSTKVPVTYAEARYLKRPKGARPGLVTLTRRKTVIVRPESGESRHP